MIFVWNNKNKCRYNIKISFIMLHYLHFVHSISVLCLRRSWSNLYNKYKNWYSYTGYTNVLGCVRHDATCVTMGDYNIILSLCSLSITSKLRLDNFGA